MGKSQFFKGYILAKKNYCLLTFCLFFIAISTTTYASTLFVASDNSSTGEDGSSISPFHSIQRAVDQAVSGDEIIVAAGEYNENVSINKSLTLRTSAPTTTISGQGLSGAAVTLAANNITFTGFAVKNSSTGLSITGSNCSVTGNHFSTNFVAIGVSGGNNSILNNAIENNTWYGIWLEWTPGGNQIIGNKINANGRGLLLRGGGYVNIRENDITNNTAGIHFDQNPNGADIYNNNFIGNTSHLSNYYGSNPLLFSNYHWHNGYPKGGNYWDNWTGPDVNADHIVDQPYFRDFYPVTEPYGWKNILPEHPITNRTSGIQYFTIAEALAEANEGDVIEAEDGDIAGKGVYYESLNIVKSLTLRSANGNATIVSSTQNPAVTLAADYITFTGFAVKNSSTGLSITGSNNSILNNTIENNGYGIWLEWTPGGNQIIGNKINANTRGLLLRGGGYVNIRENDITNNSSGIHFDQNPSGADIYNNNFIGNTSHLSNYYGSNPLLFSNYHWHNGYLKGGNYWDNWTGPDVNADHIVDQPYFRDFYPVTEPYGWKNILPEHSITNRTSGIQYSTIAEALTEANEGDVIEAEDGAITGKGVYYESLNIVKSLTLRSNGNATIVSSTQNPAVTLAADYITFTGFAVKNSSTGLSITGSNCSVTDNHFSTNFVAIGVSGGNNSILNNAIENNTWYGIWLEWTPGGNQIIGNKINANGRGLLLRGGGYVKIRENDITNNSSGIHFDQNPNGADIYNNNFIGNTSHLSNYYGSNPLLFSNYHWHNGYPKGGNYWDNWTDPDELSGPDQNLPGADGIVDTPYYGDRFPFVKPSGWLPQNTIPVANAGQNLTIIAGESFILDASASYDPDGTILKYVWDFGNNKNYEEFGGMAPDGIFDGKTGYRYDSTGIFTVTITVTDDFGQIATDSATVTVLSLTEGIENLTNTIINMGLSNGATNALSAKLSDVNAALANLDTYSATEALQDLINQVSAIGFSENNLSEEEQTMILTEAQRLLTIVANQ